MKTRFLGKYNELKNRPNLAPILTSGPRACSERDPMKYSLRSRGQQRFPVDLFTGSGG